MIFRALPKHWKNPVLVKFFAPQAKSWKTGLHKNAFLGTFWKILTKKMHFFWRALPPQSKYIFRVRQSKYIFRKFLGSVTKYGYLEIVQRGDPLVGRESNPCRRGRPPPPPKSAPGQQPPPQTSPPLVTGYEYSNYKELKHPVSNKNWSKLNLFRNFPPFAIVQGESVR